MKQSLCALTVIISLFSAPHLSAQVEPFVGEIRWVGFNFAPRGWAHCDGQLLAISSNAALFSLLGTTYGGDGRTTFALPDMRGRVIVHPGSGPGLSNYRWGQRGGSESVTLSNTQIPSHTHTLNGSEAVANSTAPTNNRLAAKQRTNLYTDDTGVLATMDSGSISATGGGQAHENRPPYLSTYCIIALQGIYPSRN